MLQGKILLVNDDPGDAPAYAGKISALGFDVETCDSYDEGARRIGAESFDFVIVGQGTAAFEGRRVLESAMQLHRHIPTLVVARSLNLPNYLEAMGLGAVDYLERPQPEEVVSVLETQFKQPSHFLIQPELN